MAYINNIYYANNDIIDNYVLNHINHHINFNNNRMNHLINNIDNIGIILNNQLDSNQINIIRGYINDYYIDQNYDYLFTQINDIINRANQYNQDNQDNQDNQYNQDNQDNQDNDDDTDNDNSSLPPLVNGYDDNDDDDYDDLFAIPLCVEITKDTLSEKIKDNCAICLKKMNLVNLTITRCGHLFHSSCMIKTMERYNKCSICRTDLK